MANEEPYDPKKHGAIQAAPPPVTEEAYDPEKHGKASKSKPLEFQDAPTIGHLPLPGIKATFLPEGVRKAMGLSGEEGLSVGGKAATLFGPTLTDSPEARIEILAKHLPGATATTDKYGNPMIEYQGKKYYGSRPGEFDAMDAGRIATGTALSLPALALAPASLPAAVALGVGTNVAQSIGEDVATRQLGGTSQEVDLTKASIGGLLGALPVLGKPIAWTAGKVYGLLSEPFLDAAGTLTAKGAAKLKAAGIDVDILKPEQLKALDLARKENFGSVPAVQTQTRKELAGEFGTTLDRAQTTRDASDIIDADTMRYGGRGGPAKEIMQTAGERQQAELTEAQKLLREGVTGQPIMKADEAGAKLSQGFIDADSAAKKAVTDAYGASNDAATQAAHGIVNKVPTTHMADLGNTVLGNLTTGPTAVVIDKNFTSLYPNASKALDIVKDWSATAAAPGTGGSPKITGLSWDSVDKMRRQLTQYRDAAVGNGTDYRAVKRIVDGFDDHFSGLNPLLDAARGAHADRMGTFMPGRGNTAATNRTLKTLGLVDDAGEPVAPGAEVVNKIFSTMNKGEAKPVIEHLKRVYAGDDVAMGALKDQALSRLMTDEFGQALSPQKATTALNKALKGKGESAYEALFSEQELNTLKRYLQHNEGLADVLKIGNPSKTSYGLGNLLRKGFTSTVLGGGGAAAGAAIGSGFGMPHLGAELGGGLGLFAGKKVDDFLGARAARSMVSPHPNLMPADKIKSRLGLTGGLLGDDLYH